MARRMMTRSSLKDDVPIPKLSTLEMVIEAIAKTKDERNRKGSSFVAIKEYIFREYNDEVESKTLLYRLKMAVKKGLKEGIFVRPTHCLNSLGANGSFKLANPALAKLLSDKSKPSDQPKQKIEVSKPESKAKVKTSKRKP